MLVADIHHVSLNVSDTERALGLLPRRARDGRCSRVPTSRSAVRWLDAGAGRQVHLIEARCPDRHGSACRVPGHPTSTTSSTSCGAAGIDVRPTASRRRHRASCRLRARPRRQPDSSSPNRPDVLIAGLRRRRSGGDRSASRRSQRSTAVVTVAIPIWLPIGADHRHSLRFGSDYPLVRLLAFAVGWCWIESDRGRPGLRAVEHGASVR